MLTLSKTNVSTRWTHTTNSTYPVTLQSKASARQVPLSLPEGDYFFGDKYFNLLPCETKALSYRMQAPLPWRTCSGVWLRTLTDAF